MIELCPQIGLSFTILDLQAARPPRQRQQGHFILHQTSHSGNPRAVSMMVGIQQWRSMLKLLMLNEIKIEGRRMQGHPNCDTPENLSLTRADFWNA